MDPLSQSQDRAYHLLTSDRHRLAMKQIHSLRIYTGLLQKELAICLQYILSIRLPSSIMCSPFL